MDALPEEKAPNEGAAMKTAYVPVYVLATDGLLYLDQVIRGVSLGGVRYFITFEDNLKAEIVIDAAGVDEVSARRKAAGILCEIGLRARLLFGPMTCGRVLDRVNPFAGLESGHGFFFDLLDVVPAGLLRGKGRRNPGQGECVIFSAGKSWGD